MNKSNVLFVNGIRDDCEMQIEQVNDKGIISYRNNGICELSKYIKPVSFKKFDLTLDLYPNSQISLPKNLRVIVNQIAEADTHQKTLLRMRQLQKFLSGKVHFINQPSYILQTTRDQVYQKLHQLPGIVMPKTIRVQPLSPKELLSVIQSENLSFPMIIRETGVQGGATSILLNHIEDVLHLYAIAMDGREYYLTEFVDYQRKGLFHKYRIIVVDGEPYIRHLYFSENWMIHRKSSKIYQDLYPKEQAEAIQLLENFHHRLKPQILTQISCIYHELKLDYFGVDCDILADGRLLIFEANATMTTLLNYDKSPNHFDKPISILKNAIEAMILNRINSTNLEKQNND